MDVGAGRYICNAFPVPDAGICETKACLNERKTEMIILKNFIQLKFAYNVLGLIPEMCYIVILSF